MLSRFPSTLVATLAVSLAAVAPALAQSGEPARFPASVGEPRISADQELANAIGDRVRQSGLLRDFSVDILVRGGTVLLKGDVASQPQLEEVLRLVQGTPGVVRVLPQVSVAGQVQRVQATQPPVTLPPPTPGPGGAVPTPAPIPGGVPGGVSAGPMPIFRAPGPPAYHQMNPPRMPSYSWPTYAPYNNYSRVAYPTAYPYNAWPFIGPFYPYPKVPLGWRSVKLEWDDGHWWYGRVGTKYNWWRLRFW